MVSKWFQRNKAYTYDTKATFLTSIFQFLMILFLPKFTINLKDFYFKIVNIPNLDDDVPC